MLEVCYSRQAPDGGCQDALRLRHGGGGTDEQQALHVRSYFISAGHLCQDSRKRVNASLLYWREGKKSKRYLYWEALLIFLFLS